jgi:hypothetical protein
VRLEVTTPDRTRQLYREQGGFAAANADFLLGFEDYSGDETAPAAAESFDPASFGPLPMVEQVTARPARTFAAWAHDHADDFR